MPTNGFRSENSWPEEAPENAIISNLDNDDEDDDDFENEIWYHDEPVPINLNDAIDNRMDHYIPLAQDPNDDDDASNNGVSYRQQYRVEWISTDQPLFDRELLESQRESNNNNNDNNDSNDNSATDSKEKLEEPSQTTTSTAEDNDKKDSLPQEKIETIKNLMANFKLPDENYPNWAKNIPEEEWKNHLKKT